MTVLILAGFDEAGYGPRLGPLVVGWTAFRVADAPRGRAPCLFRALRAVVRREATGPESKVWVADSKMVKPRKDGLALLELATLSFLGARAGSSGGGSSRVSPATLGELLEVVGGTAARYPAPWYDGLEAQRVPVRVWPGEVAARAARIREAAAAAGVEPLGALILPLPEWELNEAIDPDTNKADAMQQKAFLPLLRALRTRFPGELLSVVADKHGGRSFYQPLLEDAFPGARVVAEVEGADRSAYAIETELGPVAIAFEPEADARHFTVALASMGCKYLRELFMDRLNAFFLERTRDLRPTAGYPGDAEGFLEAIEPVLEAQKIERDRLVRSR